MIISVLAAFEEWGFILFNSQNGLLSNEEILEEVFERSLFVINQRLQGLLLPDDRYIHRSLGDNIHCCLAGRGNSARQCSIGYSEGVYSYEESEIKGVLTVGPWSGSKDNIKGIVQREASHVEDLIFMSSKIVSDSISRPAIDSDAFRGLRKYFLPQSARRGIIQTDLPMAEVPSLDAAKIAQGKAYETLNYSYTDWTAEQSPLTTVQRAILEEDILLKYPLRLIGAAGSGKTLLMQLLCLRRLIESKKNDQEIRVLYVVHNNDMAETINNRFVVLGGGYFLDNESLQRLHISTLFGYSQTMLNVPSTSVIDKDAFQTKLFQRSLIKECIKTINKKDSSRIEESQFLKALVANIDTQDVYADLIGTEIGVAIKGRDLGNDSKKYITSEKPLSRLHGALNQSERSFVYNVYQEYHTQLFEQYETLDADDIAISMLGHFKTPLWEMKRKTEGFDFVFVDETQLFNENERCLFHLLSKDDKSHLPIALALDEAQSLYGAITSGFGSLGIENLSNQMLQSVHRSTKSILELAFFILQRTTDLFTTDFPDFTKDTITVVPDNHPLARKPCLSNLGTQSIAKSVLRSVRSLRKENIRQIAVVIHTERYWSEIVKYLNNPNRDLPVIVQSKRGEITDPKNPIVVITRPEIVGGQEFDAVLAVGIEKGIVPPIVKNHSGLQSALEQQALREMYLSFTRARYILNIINSNKSMPSPLLQPAIDKGLIQIQGE